MQNIPNTFVIGFSKECSFPETIVKLEKDNVIKVADWVTTKGFGTIDLMDFYHGRYFNQHEITHQIPSELRDQIDQYLFEFCYINSRTFISHSYTNQVHTNIYHEVHEFNKFAQVIYDIFIAKKIELVLFQEIPHDGAEIILYRLAKIMGIKTIIMANFTHFWGRSFAFYSLEDFGNFAEIPDLSNDADTVKIDYQDFKGKIFYMNNIGGYLAKVSFLEKRFKELRNKFLIRTLSGPLFSKKKLDKTLFSLTTTLLQYFGAKEYQKNIESALCNDVDLSKKYIYFALHLDPEIPTIPALAGKYYDQMRALENLSSAIPDGMLIYVKENPKQTDIMRSKSFFDRLRKLKNVKLVNRNTYELIDNSQFVATISGTVGWEAMTGGKNVLIFGKSWYQNFPGAFRFDEKFNIEEIINYKIDRGEFEKAVKNLINKSGHGMVYFDFNNQNSKTKITDIYPKYNKDGNIDALCASLKKLIEN